MCACKMFQGIILLLLSLSTSCYSHFPASTFFSPSASGALQSIGGQQTHTLCEKYCNCILLLAFTHAINYMEVCTGGWGTEGSAVSSRAQAFTDKHTDYIPKLLPASPRSKRSGKMFHHSSIGRRSEHSINKSLGNGRVEGNTLQNWEDLKVLKACSRQKWVTGAIGVTPLPSAGSCSTQRKCGWGIRFVSLRKRAFRIL